MRKFLLGVFLAITLSCACLFVGCQMTGTPSTPQTPEVVGELDVLDVYVSAGRTADIIYAFSDDATEGKVTFASDSDLVFENDKVKGFTVGDYTVTATSGDYSAEFIVHVIPSLFTIEDFDIEKGYYDYIKVDFEVPAEAEELEYLYDTSKLTIDPATLKITPNKMGSYQIIAKNDYYQTDFTVTVLQTNNTSSYASTLTGRLAQITSTTDQSSLTVFAGDSFMDPAFFDHADRSDKFFTKNFKNANAVMIGVGGSKAYQWYYYLQDMVTIQPENLVLHIGTNDIFDWGYTAERTTDMVIKLLDACHKQMPNTNVYWWSIEPRVGVSHNVGNAKALLVNADVLAYAQENSAWLTYIDSATPFAEDIANAGGENYTLTEYYTDNIHPTYAGYELMLNLAYDAGLEITYFENTFSIENISEVYPGYFAYINYIDGESSGVSYSCTNSGITVEDGKVKVASSVSAGTYTVTAVKGSSQATFTVTVKNVQFLNAQPGSTGTGFIDRLNSTLGTISSYGYTDGELVIFGGDSFMDERWFFKDFYTRFAGKNAHLDGISSSRAEQWIWYGQKLIAYNPKALVLHIGTNDIFDGGKSANDTITILKNMFDLYHKYMPNTKIYWWSIEPRLGSAQEAGNAKCETVNAAIKTYMQGKDWLVYLDSATPFKADAYSNGVIKSSYTQTTLYGDSVHPSCPAGYDKLMEIAYAGGLTISAKDSTVITLADSTTVAGTDKMSTAKSVAITGDMLFTSTLTITGYNNNGHITLHFNTVTSSTPRFLLWNDANNGKFRYTASSTWPYPASTDAFNATGSDKTVDLAVLIKGKNAYMFIDGTLRCMYLNLPFETLTTFYYGAEGVSATFASSKVYNLDHAGAQSYVSKIAKYENSDNPKELKVVDMALNKTMLTDYSVLQSATDTQVKDDFGTAPTVAYGYNYLYNTDVTISSFASNAHVTINFVNSANNGSSTRFLIWNHASDGKFYFVPWTDSYNGWNNKGSATKYISATSGTNVTINVKVLVTGDNAYLFVNDVLSMAWLNIIADCRLEIGTESITGKFASNTLYKNGSTEYSTYLAKVSTYEAMTVATSTTYANLG